VVAAVIEEVVAGAGAPDDVSAVAQSQIDKTPMGPYLSSMQVAGAKAATWKWRRYSANLSPGTAAGAAMRASGRFTRGEDGERAMAGDWSFVIVIVIGHWSGAFSRFLEGSGALIST